MIKLENLTKHFSQKNGTTFKAVDNVNLNVPEGEMCVLLGPSGCGKTTTLKMINRLISRQQRDDSDQRRRHQRPWTPSPCAATSAT